MLNKYEKLSLLAALILSVFIVLGFSSTSAKCYNIDQFKTAALGDSENQVNEVLLKYEGKDALIKDTKSISYLLNVIAELKPFVWDRPKNPKHITKRFEIEFNVGGLALQGYFRSDDNLNVYGHAGIVEDGGFLNCDFIKSDTLRNWLLEIITTHNLH